MDEFVISYVPLERNPRANALAQQASGHDVQKKEIQEWMSVFDKAEGYILEELVQLPLHPVRPCHLV
jgi:hypothetical protein